MTDTTGNARHISKLIKDLTPEHTADLDEWLDACTDFRSLAVHALAGLREAIRVAWDEGATHSDIAGAVGVSRQRIGQVLARGRHGNSAAVSEDQLSLFDAL